MSDKRYGIIDIGTNSVRYMLADFKNAGIFPLFSDKRTTRLGEGLYTPEHRLQAKPMSDSVEAVKEFVTYSKENNADRIIIIATSAVRDSSNKEEFKELIKAATGLELTVLSGDEEALAGFTGALSGAFDAKNTVLCDIGGGSTEIIGLSCKKIKGKSYECGCVRLKELFGSDITSAEKFVDSTVKVPKNKNIIWIGGTASAVAMIHKGITVYDIEKVHLTDITLEEIKVLYEKVKDMSKEELDRLCAFDKKRGEILVYGLMSIISVMKKAGANKVTVSEKGLMDGIIKLDNKTA